MATDLPIRLRPFLDAGLLSDLPTPFQLRQGELEMAPWVISTDVTDESAYRRSIWAHPVLRQPRLLVEIGLDHFAMGSGLNSALGSVVKHLQLTWHSGFPVFDLQLIQTHEGGLDALRRSLLASRDGTTAEGRRLDGLARRLFVDADGYYARFLDDGGWIDRAAAFDYPTAAEEGSAVPEHFFGLAPLIDHCARAYPATPGEVGLGRVPLHSVRLVTARFREVGGFGWTAAARRLIG